mgnify:CR=1 FL=1
MKRGIFLFIIIGTIFFTINVDAAKVLMTSCTNYSYTKAYFNLVHMNKVEEDGPSEVHLMYTTDGRLVYCTELGKPLYPYEADPSDPLPDATYIVASKTGAFQLLARALAYGYNSNENADAGGNNQWGASASCTGFEERIATQMLVHMINKDYYDGGIPWETYTAANIRNFFAEGSSSGINKIANYFVEIRNKVVSEGKTPNFNPKTVTLKYNESSHRWSGSTTDTAKVLAEKDWIVTNSGTVNLSISGNTITMTDSDGIPTSGSITLSRSIYDTGTIYKSSYDTMYQATTYYIASEPSLKNQKLNYTLEQIGKGQVKINKTDSYTKEKISGVRFGIYSNSNCTTKATDYLGNQLEEKTTNKNGEVEWNNLYYPINGSKNYYIKEISVPAEYEEDEVGICKKVTIKAEDNEYADDKEEVTMKIENIPKGKATILVSKVDKYTGGPIEGVKFGIYQDNKCTVKATNYKGEEYEVKETNKIGMLQWEELYYPIGENGEKKYYIKEEEVPNSYTVDEEQLTNLGAENGCIEIEVKKAGEEIGLTTIEMQTLYNIPYGNITIMKRDAETDEVIEGVEFRLLKHVPDAENNPAEDINGNIVANEVTGPNGVAEFKDIPYGDYILEEVRTNGSYEILEEPIEFTLSEENDALKFKAQGTEALPEDELIPLETYRVGDPTDDGKIDNSDVELIEWIINKETEEEVTAKQRYASDVNGDEQVTEVDKDLVISYIEGSTDSIPNALEEKVIPGQYQKRVTLTVTNVPIDIKISKYEIAKEKELKGAKIKILNSEGEVFYEYTSKGEREEFGISTGEYTLIEETSPKGYENLQIEIKFRVGTDGNIEIISEETNLYKIIKSEEEKDKDMDHIIIYNKLAEVKVPNTASTITVVGIALGIGLIGYGGYQVYRRYRTVS